MNTLQKLQKNHKKFIYRGYEYSFHNGFLEIEFHYRMEPELVFRSRVRIEGIRETEFKRTPKELVDNAVFHLGLVDLLSYWKSSCAPIIEICPHALNKRQRTFWKKVIKKGMGQFFFENNIPWNDDSVSFSFQKREVLPSISLPRVKKHALVPVGGGKDSVVTLALLRKAGLPVTSLALNPHGAIKKTITTFGPDRKISVTRTIDPLLLELNTKGYLNGHTPFSAYLAFLSLLTASITLHKFIPLSNERSANEGTTVFQGHDVNHQWSKTFEFETMLRSYAKEFICPSIEYFSLLRPLYELQITKLFSLQKQYHHKIVSCNEAYKTNSGRKKPLGTWCGSCAKCLFVYTSLFPFLPSPVMYKIFKRNLFEQKNLVPILEELVGKRVCKPFECVGTRKESATAFALCVQRYRKEKKPLPFLLAHFEKISKHSRIASGKSILRAWNSNHAIPSFLERIVRSEWKRHCYE
jgi:hypothetical protein